MCPLIAAFNAYLGNDKESWPKYDATELAKSYDGPKLPPVLIDQVVGLTVIQLNEVALQWPARWLTATHERAAMLLRLCAQDLTCLCMPAGLE